MIAAIATTINARRGINRPEIIIVALFALASDPITVTAVRSHVIASTQLAGLTGVPLRSSNSAASRARL